MTVLRRRPRPACRPASRAIRQPAASPAGRPPARHRSRPAAPSAQRRRQAMIAGIAVSPFIFQLPTISCRMVPPEFRSADITGHARFQTIAPYRSAAVSPRSRSRHSCGHRIISTGEDLARSDPMPDRSAYVFDSANECDRLERQGIAAIRTTDGPSRPVVGGTRPRRWRRLGLHGPRHRDCPPQRGRGLAFRPGLRRGLQPKPAPWNRGWRASRSDQPALYHRVVKPSVVLPAAFLRGPTGQKHLHAPVGGQRDQAGLTSPPPARRLTSIVRMTGGRALANHRRGHYGAAPPTLRILAALTCCLFAATSIPGRPSCSFCC